MPLPPAAGARAPSAGSSPGRLRTLNDRAVPAGRRRYVLYWMQQSQRAEGNHALEHAVAEANQARLPLLVAFGLTDGYPEANARHYRFLLEGLAEVAATLSRRGAAFVLRRGDPAQVALSLCDQAALLVCDRGYLRHQVRWRATVAAQAPCPVVEVEADVVVPVDAASDKREFAARTIRPKITRQLDRWLVPAPAMPLRQALSARDAARLAAAGDDLDPAAVDDNLARLNLDRSVPPVPQLFRGGHSEARAHLTHFLRTHLPGYADNRTRPAAGAVSHLAKYLHFGHISPVDVALAARKARIGGDGDRASFLEELIVRRELAQNFVARTEDYDRFESAIPDWARATLLTHQRDPRRPHYAPAQLEAARTADPYWNAAMREMKHTGYMHNALRMYWGKKILEWSSDPARAHRLALHLNNKYLLDGRDPNSYANVGWIFGLHDRPFAERPIYGKVRCMTRGGLERKSDIGAYVAQVDELVARLAPERTRP